MVSWPISIIVFQLLELTKSEGGEIDRAKLEDLLKQKFFYDMSFSIYGGKLLL